MSSNESRWDNIELFDLSGGGLSFYSGTAFTEGERLFFNLYVYNMLSEFNIRLEGRIVRIDGSKGRHLYAVRFENMNKYHQVQIDELVKSKVTVKNTPEHDHVISEEEHMIFLMTRLNRRSHRLRANNYK
jgi:c-di-GMP-binding flagellar brake protein YcgR